ncbi:MAG TPA: CGNR zinc finger domain-containing protein [Solirubrobacterales bacterium]|nr:CGNR zinc finger domain-containing protein [Solirubrobacterales bacterium]
MRRQDLPPDLRRRFRTGRPCLDFTHTGGEGEFAAWELLHEPADVARFLGVVVGVDGLRVRRADLPAVRRLRGAITRAARLAASGGSAAGADVAAINAAADHAPLVPRLTAGGESTLVPGTARQALSALARDAIDLFSSPLAGRIRVCAADDCGLLFVDASRPGRRRWCSMERCGDRAKKRKARGHG